MMEKLRKFMLGENLSTRESLFRIIVIVGQSLGVLAIVQSFVNDSLSILLVVQFLEILLMFVAAVMVFKYHKLEEAITLMWFAICVIEFPTMFIISGGTNGGAAVWFSLGLFYVFMMCQGRTFWLFLIINILIDTLIYLYAYLNPQRVVPVGSKLAVYMDSLFGAMAVGIASGIIVRFQIRLYRQEKALAERQNVELENAAKAQNTFFASMSHEIRTPINSIIGLNEMIQRKSDNEEISNYAETVQVSGKILLDLVNDILDYAQLSQHSMQIVEAEYSTLEMYRNIVRMMQVRMQEKNLNFVVDIDPEMPLHLLGDEKRVEQIMINLLTNAVKYTNEGVVRMNAFSEPMEEGRVKIILSVQDTGIGIRKENLEKLYTAFERVDGKKNQKVEGSGLGLAITKQLLELMGGDIHVDSIYTKGTTFTVSFIQRLVDAKSIGRIDFLKAASSNKQGTYVPLFEAPEARILLVDDNSMNAYVLQELLSETKVKLEVALNGQECLEKTVKKSYHMILMDYMMPDMNGADVLKEIRRQSNGLCKETPVILMTASYPAEAQKLVDEFSFDGFLGKPVQTERLERELLRFLPDNVIEEHRENLVFDEDEIAMARKSRRKYLCITSDTVSDLPLKVIDELNIRIVPLYIRTDKGRFADTQEIDSDNMMQFLTDTNTYARADSLSVEEYEQFFAECLTEAENVIHIAMASRAGRSYGVAIAAAKGFDHVHVIDSGQISCGQGMLAICAATLAKEGMNVEEICNRLNNAKQLLRTRFIMPNANVFYQSGYTNRLIAFLCELFHAHPVVSMSKSCIFITGVHFGNLQSSWRRFIRSNLRNVNSIDTGSVYITYTNLTTQEQEFIKKEILKCVPFERVIMQKASFSTSCNAGVHTMGFSYFKKA